MASRLGAALSLSFSLSVLRCATRSPSSKTVPAQSAPGGPGSPGYKPITWRNVAKAQDLGSPKFLYKRSGGAFSTSRKFRPWQVHIHEKRFNEWRPFLIFVHIRSCFQIFRPLLQALRPVLSLSTRGPWPTARIRSCAEPRTTGCRVCGTGRKPVLWKNTEGHGPCRPCQLHVTRQKYPGKQNLNFKKGFKGL